MSLRSAVLKVVLPRHSDDLITAAADITKRQPMESILLTEPETRRPLEALRQRGRSVAAAIRTQS